MTTLEEIAATENWVKGSNSLDDGEKYRWLTSLADKKAKELAKDTAKPASKEELDAVMAHWGHEFRRAPKPESEKTDHEREIDTLLKSITPWM